MDAEGRSGLGGDTTAHTVPQPRRKRKRLSVLSPKPASISCHYP